jgi:hypothetical protein
MRYITISVVALIPAIAAHIGSGPEQDPVEIAKSLVFGAAFQTKRNCRTEKTQYTVMNTDIRMIRALNLRYGER